MQRFLARHGRHIAGVLSGFDRVVFRGTLRRIAYADGLGKLMSYEGVLLKGFGEWADGLTQRLRRAVQAFIDDSDRPYRYLRSSQISKEQLVREILRENPVDSGLICVFGTRELGQSFEIQRHRESKMLRLRSVPRPCMHYYWYVRHPQYGLLHVRLQTWLPFTVQVCMNGREWLARQMDEASLGYEQDDNCFPRLEDPVRTQELMDEQLQTDWRSMLESIVGSVHPLHGQIFRRAEVPYYWTTHQSEWATDVTFKSSRYLSEIYPLLLRHAIVCLHSPDVLRFLGKSASGPLAAQVTGSLRTRHEGTRIKHAVNANTVKAYDKGPGLLRIECTINNPRDLRVWRPKEGDPDGPPAWRPMRKGVADTYRRVQVSQRANDRYADALAEANTDDPQPLQDALAAITRPVMFKGRRARALRPLHNDDARLLEAVARGEFTITGFRNRDIVRLLHGDRTRPANEARRLSARVTRLLRLLRAHGLIKRIVHTHRYQLTPKGRRLTAAINAARQLPLGRLQQALAAA